MKKAKAELYTTPTCKYCNDVKRFFEKYEIPYSVYDITKNEEAKRRLIEDIGERSVPVTMIGETKIVGYDEAKLKAAFGIESLKA